MNTLTTVNNNEVTMTLKEVVDILNREKKRGDKGYIEHNKAMLKVTELALEEGFGNALIIRITISVGNKGGKKVIDTYKLNKKQCLAVAASLNTKALMSVINKLEELETANKQLIVPTNFEEAMLLGIKLHKDNELLKAQALLDAPKVKFAELVEQEELSISIGDWAKMLSKVHGEKIGPNKLMAFLRDLKYLMKGRDCNERNKPYQKYIDAKYFEVKYNKTPRGLFVQPLVTSLGQLELSETVVNFFSSNNK